VQPWLVPRVRSEIHAVHIVRGRIDSEVCVAGVQVSAGVNAGIVASAFTLMDAPQSLLEPGRQDHHKTEAGRTEFPVPSTIPAGLKPVRN
jgi:hypothetical protein